MKTAMTRADSMHRIRDDEWSNDSGVGDSNESTDVLQGATDFACSTMTTSNGGGGTQKLDRKMATMYIGKEKKISDQDLKDIYDDDECARDCHDTTMTSMPPPALPSSFTRTTSGRRVLGDITSTINSPVATGSKYSRNATMPTTSANSTGGLRNRKRMFDCSPASSSPFGSFMMGKRWRKAETIDEHSEAASTSYATTRVDRSDENATVTFARPHTITRVQSTSVLEKGIYAHHRDENVPELLEVSYSLSTLEHSESHVFRRIKAATLAEMIRTMGDEFEKSYTLIDCRYPYEYEGGHIQGATNVFDPSLVDARFFSPLTSLLKKEEKEGAERKIPIFYCEFSQKRGPSMALAVRAFDRIRNSLAYPHVDHAEMYVLDGGYRGFYNAVDGFKDLCLPCGYIEMEDAKYKKEMDKFKHHKSRTLLSFNATVSRLPQPTTQEAKLARRAEQSASSPISSTVTRRASRRALQFNDDVICPSSPSSRPVPTLSVLPNPQFS